MLVIIELVAGPRTNLLGDMGEVIRFVSKSEHERARLIRIARAIYDGVFPSADPVNEQRDHALVDHVVGSSSAKRDDGGLAS